MKTITSALVALVLLTGLTGSAKALDARATTIRLIAITTSRQAGAQNGHCQKKDLPIVSRRTEERPDRGLRGEE